MQLTARIEGADELRDQLAFLRTSARQALREAALAGADIIHAAALDKAPGPHVYMQVETLKDNEVEVHIGPDLEHFYYGIFETGAEAHEIGPHVKQALRFVGASGEIITKLVEHPGMVAEPWMRPAMDAHHQEATARVAEVLRRAIAKVAIGRALGG